MGPRAAPWKVADEAGVIANTRKSMGSSFVSGTAVGFRGSTSATRLPAKLGVEAGVWVGKQVSGSHIVLATACTLTLT